MNDIRDSTYYILHTTNYILHALYYIQTTRPEDAARKVVQLSEASGAGGNTSKDDAPARLHQSAHLLGMRPFYAI